ncbi:MAG: TIGR03936 family radical SAM-associated protein [Candidatus Omnitrophota bacterium]
MSPISDNASELPRDNRPAAGVRIDVIFSKKGEMKFISHLDLMRLFQRALRRAGLPVRMTQGFNPHLKFSITKALKLGIESDREEAVFYLTEPLEGGEFIRRINSALPEGVAVTEATQG